MFKSEKFWNWLSKNYDKNAMDQTFVKIVEKTPKHLDKDYTILDFACATGLYSIEFAKYVRKIEAFDISSKMIEIAKNKVKKNQIENIAFSQTTLFDEKYQKGKFDVILTFNILLYFNDVEKVLNRLHDLLKPGGLIITSTACLKEKRSFLAILTTPLLFVISRLRLLPFIRFFKMNELEQTVSAAGFDIVDTEILMDSPATEYFIAARKSLNL